MLKSSQQIANVQVVNPKITWAVYGMHLLQTAAIVIICIIIERQYRPQGFIKLHSTTGYPKKVITSLQNPGFILLPRTSFNLRSRTSFSFCFKARFGLKFRKSFKLKFRTSFKIGGGGGGGVTNTLKKRGVPTNFFRGGKKGPHTFKKNF
jgi:hypothetical protein